MMDKQFDSSKPEAEINMDSDGFPEGFIFDDEHETPYDPFVDADENNPTGDNEPVEKKSRKPRPKGLGGKLFPSSSFNKELINGKKITSGWLETLRRDNIWLPYLECTNFALVCEYPGVACIQCIKINDAGSKIVSRYDKTYRRRLREQNSDVCYFPTEEEFNKQVAVDIYHAIANRMTAMANGEHREALIVKCPKTGCLGKTVLSSGVTFNSRKEGIRKEKKYKCTKCGYQFVLKHTYIAELKQETFRGILCFGFQSYVSYRQIAEELKVSPTTLSNWVKEWGWDFSGHNE